MPRITYVQTPVAHLVGPGKLKVINGRLAFTTGKPNPLRLDLNSLRTIYCYGSVGITDEALRLILQHGVDLAWLTPAGNRCRGRLVGANPSTIALRLLQHRVLAYPPACLDLARFVVAAKVRSQLQAARHYQRHGQTAATVCGQRIQQVAQQLAAAQDLENLRGLEGQASAAWYELFAQLLAPPWHFPGRERRPPTDPVNALLSLGYMLLFRRLEGRCDALGLETGLGALHAFRPGRPSLVCDLIEPLRLPAVDRWVLQVCAGGQLTREHFVVTDKGVHLTEERLPSIIANWEAHYWQGGQERALDRWLREWIARLRQWVGRLPPLLQESSEEGGVGNSRSGL